MLKNSKQVNFRTVTFLSKHCTLLQKLISTQLSFFRPRVTNRQSGFLIQKS